MRKGQAYLAISVTIIVMSLSLMYFVEHASEISITGRAVHDTIDCSDSNSLGQTGPNGGKCCNANYQCGVDSACYFCGTDNECKFLGGPQEGCNVCAQCDGIGGCDYIPAENSSCNQNNVARVSGCLNNPDNIPLTYDYYAGFVSGCVSKHTCSPTPTDWQDTITHTCDIHTCGAECETNDDCKCGYDTCMDSDNDGAEDDWVDYPSYGLCNNCQCNVSTSSGQGCAPINIITDAAHCAVGSYNAKSVILWNDYHKVVAGKLVEIPVEIENVGVQVVRQATIKFYVADPSNVKALIDQQAFAQLNVGEKKQLEFNYTFLEEGNYNITIVLSAGRDDDLSDNVVSRIVGAIVERPEIKIINLAHEQPIIVGNKTNITATLQHFGSKVANNVIVSLFYSPYDDYEVLVSSYNLGSIAVGSQNVTQLEWIPQKPGYNYLIVYVNYSYNNLHYSAYQILQPQAELQAVDVRVDLEFKIGSVTKKLDNAVANTKYDLELSFYNDGQFTAENISYKLFDNNALINQSTISSLAPLASVKINTNWTPTTTGSHELKLVAQLENDYSLSNNQENIMVNVGEQGQSMFNITNSSMRFVTRELILANFNAVISSWQIVDTVDIPQFITIGINNKPDESVSISYNGSRVQKHMVAISDYEFINRSEQGILLRYIYANLASWNYSGVEFSFYRSAYPFENRDLGVYSCSQWNFVLKTCTGKWIKLSDTLDGRVISAYPVFAIGQRDIDDDRIPDYKDDDLDNDGIMDNIDPLIGVKEHVTTNILGIDVNVGGQNNLKQNFVGMKTVKFLESGKVKAEFEFNFSSGRINLDNVTVEKQKNNVSGAIMIRGISLMQNGTKTLYVDDLSRSNEVCIKDIEINSVDDISSGCTGSNEIKLLCPGNISNYYCTLSSGQYKITGLSHSGVRELPECVEQWECTGWSDCVDDIKARSCTDNQRCGTTVDKPRESLDCAIRDHDKQKKQRRVSVTLGALGTKPVDVVLSVQDKISFVLGGKEYFIEMLNDGKDFIDIIITPAYDSLIMTVGEVSKLDLDGDNKDDLEITFVSLKKRRATLDLKAILQPTEELIPKKKKTELEDIQKEEKVETIKEEVSEKPASYRWLTTLILGVIAFVLVISAYKNKKFFVKKPHHEVLGMFVRDLLDKEYSPRETAKILIKRGWDKKDVVKVIQAVDSHRKYSKLDGIIHFIERSLEKGYNKRQIAVALAKRGWPRQVIEAAFKGEKHLHKFMK